MDNFAEILLDTFKQFEQIEAALKVESGTPDSELAREFCARLAGGIAPPQSAHDPSASVRLEEVLVWRILARRMLRELGAQALFQERTRGAASGTAAMHPGVEGLAKTYERLRRIVDELTPQHPAPDAGTATGLPMRMMKLLEETEGFLEEALELKPGETNPFIPRLRRREVERREESL